MKKTPNPKFDLKPRRKMLTTKTRAGLAFYTIQHQENRRERQTP